VARLLGAATLRLLISALVALVLLLALPVAVLHARLSLATGFFVRLFETLRSAPLVIRLLRAAFL